jgi:hypothetical protein
MLALTNPIKTRLAALPALTGWAVRMGSEGADRRLVPAADVRCNGAVVADSRTSAVMVAPEWTVTLVVKRGDAAAGQIDAAFAAVVDSLHNWMPGQHGGRGWEPLKLTRVTEPLFDDAGLVGCELVFSTGARYMGQN